MSLHNIVIWFKDYFELKTTEKKQMTNKRTVLPHYLSKSRLRFLTSLDSDQPWDGTERNLHNKPY